MKKTPVIFTGHGSPMNAVQDNDFTRAVAALGLTLEKPKAVVMVSAHWMAQGSFVTLGEHPHQIYDFYGFPDELYKIKYTPLCPSWLTEKIVKQLSPIHVSPSADWGIDHGAWTMLKLLFPDADVPVVQLSLDMSKPLSFHYEAGALLAPLRGENILIIGSGNITHNLRQISYDQYDPKVYSWAEDFDRMVADDIDAGMRDRLSGFSASYGDVAVRSHPTMDHYIPLLYAAGAAGADKAEYFYEGFQHGSLSMRSIIFGE